MALFDAKNFNGEVFGAYVDRVPNLNRNELLKSGAVVEAPKYASMLPDQVGGNYITVPIKARIGGTASNYDGNTNIGTSRRKTYTQGRVVVGRANGWVEKDFSADISGEDFMPAAEEVAEYWDDVDQNTILAEMKGIFAMTGKENLKFVEGHTYDISKNSGDAGKFGETTLNTALQKALGDHKAKFSLAITHSAVATNLENMNLIGYAKYTDEQGIQRDVTLVTLNGRLLLIDDNMPTTEVAPVYAASTDTSVQTGKTYYTKSGTTYTPVAAPTGNPSTSSYYEMTAEGYTAYTTYAFGDGAIEYTNCGAKKPYSMSTDEAKNGGEETLWSRQRKIFSPWGISFKNTGIVSPTNEQLANGANWELANSNETGTPEYFPHKDIAIARIITRG